MRAVLDTVIFVRALINPSGPAGRLLFEANDYVIVTSPEIAQEILEVIARPDLRRRFSPLAGSPSVEEVIGIVQTAEIVEPTIRLSICRDPNDDKFFECAVEGRVDYIVSEDNDILDIAEYSGIRTLSAAQFLALLPT